jgi:ComF family protein
MMDIFQQLLDLLFPYPRDIKYLKDLKDFDFESLFAPRYFLGNFVLSEYQHPVIKAAITANKFHNYEPASSILAVLVNHWSKTIPETNTIFVPIPLSKEREKDRGYNQVTRVLNESKTNHLPLLTRTKHTKPQTSLNRTERFNNMHDVFSANIPKDFNYSQVVIIDDVVTTGATLRAAKSTLEKELPHHCKIICVAIAH